MPAEDAAALVRRAYDEIWSKGNLAAIESFYARDVVDHNPMPGQAPGLRGLQESFAMIRGAFPDMQLTIDVLLTEGDTVAARWTMQATHQGPILGIPPIGRPIAMTGIDVHRVANGKIAEIWHQEDVLGMLQQLGAISTPGQPT